MNKITSISLLTATLLFTACSDAGNDQVVLPGSLVTLEGQDGEEIKSIEWEQLSGPTVELSDNFIAHPTFIAPNTDSRVEIEFKSTIEQIFDENSSDAGILGLDILDTFVDIFSDDVLITVKHNDKILNASLDDTNKPRQFTRDDVNEIVKDSVNNLFWSDTTVVQKVYEEDITTDNDFINSYISDTAETYCSNLSLDNKEWRLPNFRELQTLVDYSKDDMKIDAAFKIVGKGNYVSKISKYLNGVVIYGPFSTFKYPRGIDFTTGIEVKVETDTPSYIRCVSGEQLEKYNFTREANSSVLLDPTNTIMWQDSVGEGSYESAVAYCEDSNLSGYSNWRLPTINELVSTIDYHEDPEYATNNTFNTRSFISYVSSTEDVNEDTNIWAITLGNDLTKIKTKSKDTNFGIRCVRDVE